MRRVPLGIITRKDRQGIERTIDNLRSENIQLKKEIDTLKADMAKMARGDRVCGKHCECCQNAYVRVERGNWGDYTNIICKLEAANTCGEFQPK